MFKKIFMSCQGPCEVQPLHPDKIPLEDVNAELVSERGLARVLVGTEGVPPLPIDCHETIIKLAVEEMALEVYL